ADLRSFKYRSRASPRSVSRSARARALAALARDTGMALLCNCGPSSRRRLSRPSTLLQPAAPCSAKFRAGHRTGWETSHAFQAHDDNPDRHGTRYSRRLCVPDPLAQPKNPKTIAYFISLLTDIFLRLIKMIIAPLVFSTLVVGVAHMGDTK